MYVKETLVGPTLLAVSPSESGCADALARLGVADAAIVARRAQLGTGKLWTPSSRRAL